MKLTDENQKIVEELKRRFSTWAGTYELALRIQASTVKQFMGEVLRRSEHYRKCAEATSGRERCEYERAEDAVELLRTWLLSHFGETEGQENGSSRT